MIRTEQLSNDAAFDAWARDLLKEAINQRHASWSVGDLMLQGLNRFDEARVWTAAEATGMTPETLTNYKSLAKTFPPGKRRLNLGISVHEAVRSLEEPARDALLDLVEKHEITRDSLRERVKAYKGGDVGALVFKWKPEPKRIEVDEPNARVIDEDKPVFDSTAAGEGMRPEREHADFEASDENQNLAKVLRALEKIDPRMLNLSSLSRDAIQAAIAKLQDIAVAKAKFDQRHIIGSAPKAAIAEAGADRAAPAVPSEEHAQGGARTPQGDAAHNFGAGLCPTGDCGRPTDQESGDAAASSTRESGPIGAVKSPQPADHFTSGTMTAAGQEGGGSVPIEPPSDFDGKRDMPNFLRRSHG